MNEGTKHDTRRLAMRKIEWIVLHRISLSQMAPGNPRPVCDNDLDGNTVIAAFRNRELGTGGKTPYHILVCKNLSVDQMLPLGANGAHAKGYNSRSIAVAVAGNHDDAMPHPSQHKVAEIVVKQLCMQLGYVPKIIGHTDLDGASADPNKRCPGRYFSVTSIKDAVDKWWPTVPPTEYGKGPYKEV